MEAPSNINFICLIFYTGRSFYSSTQVDQNIGQGKVVTELYM